MLSQKELLLEWIKSTFRLNNYEASAWLALLEKGESTAGEISKISGVPRSRVYDVLVSLERKGFIVSKLTHPIRYVALHPNLVIENLKRRLEIEFTERIANLEKIKEMDEFKKLVEIYNSSAVASLTEPTYLKGREKIYNTIHELISRLADKRLIICSVEEEVLQILDLCRRTLLKKIDEKGLEILLVGDIEERKVKDIIDRKTIKIKNPKDDIGRFVAIDDDILIMFLKNYEEIKDPEADSAILIKQKEVMKPIIKLVERLK